MAWTEESCWAMSVYLVSFKLCRSKYSHIWKVSCQESLGSSIPSPSVDKLKKYLSVGAKIFSSCLKDLVNLVGQFSQFHFSVIGKKICKIEGITVFFNKIKSSFKRKKGTVKCKLILNKYGKLGNKTNFGTKISLSKGAFSKVVGSKPL